MTGVPSPSGQPPKEGLASRALSALLISPVIIVPVLLIFELWLPIVYSVLCIGLCLGFEWLVSRFSSSRKGSPK